MQPETKIKLGGIERRIKPTLGTAVEIEDATGVGVIALTLQVARSEARVTHVAEVLRCALASTGQHYSTAEVLTMIEEHEGIVGASMAAAVVLNGLFYRPKQTKGAAKAAVGNGRIPATTAAPDATQ